MPRPLSEDAITATLIQMENIAKGGNVDLGDDKPEGSLATEGERLSLKKAQKAYVAAVRKSQGDEAADKIARVLAKSQKDDDDSSSDLRRGFDDADDASGDDGGGGDDESDGAASRLSGGGGGVAKSMQAKHGEALNALPLFQDIVKHLGAIEKSLSVIGTGLEKKIASTASQIYAAVAASHVQRGRFETAMQKALIAVGDDGLAKITQDVAELRKSLDGFMSAPVANGTRLAPGGAASGYTPPQAQQYRTQAPAHLHGDDPNARLGHIPAHKFSDFLLKKSIANEVDPFLIAKFETSGDVRVLPPAIVQEMLTLFADGTGN